MESLKLLTQFRQKMGFPAVEEDWGVALGEAPEGVFTALLQLRSTLSEAAGAARWARAGETSPGWGCESLFSLPT